MSQVFLALFGLTVGIGVVATLAHEAGHLICARLGSIPLRRMVIGWGPLLLRGHIGGMQLELRLVPLGSLVVCAESASMPKRWAVILYFLGGALGIIVVIGVVVWFHAIGATPVILHEPSGIGILVAMQVGFIVVSLTAPLAYAAAHKRYREGTTRPPIGSGSWADVRLAVPLARADRWANEGVRRADWTAMRRVLARGGLPPEGEMRVLDTLVTHGLLTDSALVADPALRSELDAWSHRALQLGPRAKTLIASRGAVLVKLGHYREGKTFLEAVAFADGADSLVSRVFLARAEHALGNTAAVGSLIAEARAIARAGRWGFGAITLIRRIERDMRSPRPRAPVRFGRRSLRAHGRLSLPRPRARLGVRRHY